MSKRDWHNQVEHERLPPNEVIETNDGKTIRIEYHDENGTIYKTSKTYRVEKLKVLPIVAERKKWKKFGNAANDLPGINTATTKVCDEVNMQFLSNREEDNDDEEKIVTEAVSSLRKVQCRLCKGDHWTTKCPYKDSLQPLSESAAEKPSDPVSNTTTTGGSNIATNGAAPTEPTGKYIPPSMRNGQRPAPGSLRAYPPGRNDPRKQDEATIRVTNLPEETQESDLRDLFTPFGTVTRVYLAKDKTNQTSKGFAFITYSEKKDAQKAIDCVSGYGYYHLILKVEWANRPQNQ